VTTVRFRAKLWAPMAGKGWTFVTLPKAASAKLGARGRVAVTGTINGFAFRTSAFPDGNGSHTIAVNAAMKKGGRVTPGQTATFVLAPATDAVKVRVPPPLQKALRRDRNAWDQWNAITPKARAGWVAWIQGAKRDETKVARVAKTVERLARGDRRVYD